jgi:uncharacterized membrane protein YqjE
MESIRTPHAQPSEQSAAELVKQVTEQTQRLVRQELALAKLEVSEKVKHAGIGAGMLAGAAFVAIFGLGTLIAMLVLALATAMEAWLAALVVTVALLAVAGVLALVGRRQLARAAPPAPEQAIQSVKTDIEAVARATGSHT